MSDLGSPTPNSSQRHRSRVRRVLSLLISLTVLVAAISFLAVPPLTLATAIEAGDGPVGATETHRAETVDGQTWYTEAPQALGPGTKVAAYTPESSQTEPVAPLAPGLITSFDGLNMSTGGGFIPPDPIAAAGPNHVVSVLNVSIQWRTKTGASTTSQSLSNFFTSLSPANATFDPKVIYDQYANRFVVITLERVSSGINPNAGNVSRILMAVSDTADPNGTWSFQAISAKTTIMGIEYWVDYPGLAIDEEAVYITGNLFEFAPLSFFGGSRLWIMDKTSPGGGLYGGGTSTVTVHDPSAAASVGFDYFTIQPAHVFGVAPAGVGTWLTTYGGLTDSVDEYVGVIRVDDPLGTPSFSNQFVFMGNLEANTIVGGGVIPDPIPDAPQAGPFSDIETNDRRTLNAVWRDNSLWTTFEIVPSSGPDAGQVTAHWVEVDTTVLGTLTLADQGDAGAEDIAAGTYTYYPSITVDQCGNMGLGFAASAPTTFVGAYYTVRYASDAAGTVQSTGTVATGLASYQLTDSIGRNRWGDYTGAALDPANEATFWVFNEYAGTPSSRWLTRYGAFASGIDFGDLPSLYNLTLFADDGARHCIGDPLLGSSVDPDGDGQESAASDGDDMFGSDDEDGVTVTGNWTGGNGSVDAAVSGGRGCLSGWIDFTNDGDFNDADEQIVSNETVDTGTTAFSFAVPVSVIGQTFNGRFRLVDDADNDGSCSDQAAVGQTGLVSSGEVEDYQWAFSSVIVPPTNVIISGPAAGMQNIAYDFEAAVTPLTTTLPLTYTWQATDQTTVVSVSNRLTDTVSFNWSTAGSKTITVTAENSAGLATDTHVITIAPPPPVPPTAVLISGPVTGAVNTSHGFTADVTPISTTLPLTYTWQATDQTPVVAVSSSLSDTVSFNWSTAGSKTITVTAENSAGSVIDTHTISIAPSPPVPPTAVLISGPSVGAINTSYGFTADVSPISTTLPLTYTWQATDQAPVVTVSSSLSDTLTYSWALTGTKTITVTAENGAGLVIDTHTIAITVTAPPTIAPTAVSISGPLTGTVGASYGFTATVTPLSTTLPLTYTWQATDQTTVVVAASSLSNAVSFTWLTPGTKTVMVTAENGAGTATDTYAIVIDVRLYLPIVFKN